MSQYKITININSAKSEAEQAAKIANYYSNSSKTRCGGKPQSTVRSLTKQAKPSDTWSWRMTMKILSGAEWGHMVVTTTPPHTILLQLRATNNDSQISTL